MQKAALPALAVSRAQPRCAKHDDVLPALGRAPVHPPRLFARVSLAYQSFPNQIGLLSCLQGVGSTALELRQIEVAGKRMPQSRSKDLLQGIPEL